MRLLLALLLALLCGAAVAKQVSKPIGITVTPAPSDSQNFVMIRVAQTSHADNSVGLPNLIGSAGSAHAPVGTLNAILKSPAGLATGATWSIAGQDASLFSIDPSTGNVTVGNTDLPLKPSNYCTSRERAACYSITATATLPGVYNSPFTDEIVFFVVDPATNPPSISLNKTIARPGDTVTATLANDPNTAGTDCLSLSFIGGHDHYTTTGPSGSGPFGILSYPQTIPITGHGGSYNFTIPNLPTGWWVHYVVALFKNCSHQTAIQSSWVSVPPSAPVVPPKQPAVAFDQPFTPAHSLTVCPAGCNYTVPSAAYDAAVAAGFDNVLIDIHAGVYNDCIRVKTGGGGGVGHVWFRGHGGDFAHVECTVGPGIGITGAGATTPPPQLVLENMEFSDSASKGVISGAFFYPYNNTLLWLRNVYVHDVVDQGIFLNASSCCTRPNADVDVPRGAYSVKMENTRVARNGSGAGPAHNMYIELPNRFDFLYSLTESSSVGHTLKSRGFVTNINCSKMLQNYNPASPTVGVWGGASAIDFSEGLGVTLRNSIIGWGRNIADNQTIMKYQKDQEIAYGHNISPTEFSYQADGNLWLLEVNGSPPAMGPDNWLPGWDPAYQQTPPSHSTNETFVGFGPNGKYEIGQTPYFFYIQGAANSPMRKNNTAYNTHDMIMTPDTPSGLIFTNIVPGTTAASQPAGYATATDTGIPLRSPSMGTVINDGTAGFQAVRSNPYFPITRLSSPDSRAHAGLPALVGYVGYGDDSARFPLPAACGSRSAGNVAVP